MASAVRIGEEAPPIEAIDVRGERWSSRDRLGRTLVVIFHRHIH